jgi:hypothetical protein
LNNIPIDSSSSSLFSSAKYSSLGYRVSLIKASQENGAVCLDGTTPNYYFRPGFAGGQNKFIVFIKGGGWCSGVSSPPVANCTESCLYRSQMDLGSSNFDQAYLDYDRGDLSTNPNVNPLTYNWNAVYIMYCG